jgi:hypothetical protein
MCCCLRCVTHLVRSKRCWGQTSRFRGWASLCICRPFYTRSVARPRACQAARTLLEHMSHVGAGILLSHPSQFFSYYFADDLHFVRGDNILTSPSGLAIQALATGRRYLSLGPQARTTTHHLQPTHRPLKCRQLPIHGYTSRQPIPVRPAYAPDLQWPAHQG